jgi:flagellar biosynthetic protein FliR
MIPALAALADLGGVWLPAAVAVFLRVGAAMALLPGFGEASIPQRVRLVLALAFTAVVLPAVLPEVSARIAAAPAPAVFLLSETICGLALGAVLRMTVAALQIAGTIAAQATSLSQIFGGAIGEPQPAMANLLTLAALALAAMAGLHVKAATALILSYEVWPAGGFPSPADMAGWGLANVAAAMALGFTLSAPFAIASLVFNVALGIINRAMPQLMVAFVGAPAMTAGGLVLLAVTLPLMLPVWLARVEAIVANPFAAGP